MNIRQSIQSNEETLKEALLTLLSNNGYSKNEAAGILDHKFRVLTGMIPQLVWRSHDLGRWTWASRQWTAFTGQSSEDSERLGWLGCSHPDDREMTMDAWNAAAQKGNLEVVHRILEPSKGEFRWFETRALPLTDDDGTVEWFGTCTDVHDLRHALDRERFLHAELQHRVRNILANLRGMLRRGHASPGSKDAFVGHFEGRLACLSRIQAQATMNPFGRIALDSLVASELFAVGMQEGRDIVFDGPDVSLSLQAAQTLSLALHELAINSIKYGTLDRQEPSLSINWTRVEGDSGTEIVISWSESAPGTKSPRRQGFGMDVLRRQVPYELGARVDLTFPPEGLQCRIALPIGTSGAGSEPLFLMAGKDV